jgi:RNA polymerase sigma factor (sigma-70 family)
MLEMTDIELLREFASRNSEQAFATLVARHVDMVYSVALRHVGNHHQAEEITQAVFILLARKAHSLCRGTVLPGWLFYTARLTAANFRRTEIRRALREQEAYMQSNLEEQGTDVWRQIAPFLDEAIAALSEKDRNAIVLHFVGGKGYPEVGAAMGASGEAAQVRVSRAVDKLRTFFTKRGIVLSSAVLSGAMAANSIQAAPAGLAAAVTAATLKGTTLTASTLTLVKGTLKLMAWTKIKITVGVGVAALVAYQCYQNASQSHQLASVQNDLQQARQQVDAQQTTIGQLQQEKQAVLEEKRNEKLVAARLLEKQRAAATPKGNAVDSPPADSPSSGLSKMMNDPAMREYMRHKELDSAKAKYRPLAQQLNLTPEQAEQFAQAISDSTMKKIAIGVGYTQGTLDRTAAHQAADNTSSELTSQLQALLGQDGYAQYQQFNLEYPARTMLKLLNDQLGNAPLDSDQSARLLQTVQAESNNLTHGITGEVDPAVFGSQETVDGYFQQVADCNQRLLQQASGFLAADQLAVFGAMLDNSLTSQKIKAATLIQKH